MSKNQPDGLPVIPFNNPKELHKWLAKHHQQTSGIWLRIYKKASGKSTVTYQEAVDEALCYGWIDGQKRSYDTESYIQKFTPRRPKSPWSKINTGKVERLIKAGRMKPAGLKQIEGAKADGRWAKAYDSSSTAKMPQDFMRAVSKNKKAKAFFATLTKANTYAIFYRLQSAKKPETRERRMKQILEMLAQGRKPGSLL
jgi:uncharacterized protein YdeI (YjbR/CyaY-like superfamily)